MVSDPPIGAVTVETFVGRIADRRKRHRVVVRWRLRIWRTPEHIFDTYTVDISSGGFYCVCSRPFSPGEVLIAVLEIPGPGGDREFQKLVLRCEVLVLRVETLIDSCNCGIACRIMNYSVLKTAEMGFGSEQPKAEEAKLSHNGCDGALQNSALNEIS